MIVVIKRRLCEVLMVVGSMCMVAFSCNHKAQADASHSYQELIVGTWVTNADVLGKKSVIEVFYADGQNNLGLMYANGQYVNKDVLQACHWYQKAAKQGHKEAKKNLFELLREALLLPQSSVKITLVADEGWEVTKDGLLYDHYAWHNDLDVTFNLEKEATVSFDWSIERSYEDNEVITDMELFVDNSDSPLWQIGACVKSTISDHVTLTLGPGKHTLKWRPSYVGKFRIKNLLIL